MYVITGMQIENNWYANRRITGMQVEKNWYATRK